VSDGRVAEAMSRPLAKGWQWIQLGQYVENLDGRRVPVSQKEREARRGDFPYYGASGVIDSIDGHTHDGEFVLIGEDGANLLTRSKPIAFQAKGKIWVNNHAHVLRCKPGYSNAYLAYYINSIDLSPYVTGTAQPKLSQSMMNKITCACCATRTAGRNTSPKSKSSSPASTKPSPTSSASRPTSNATKPPSSKPTVRRPPRRNRSHPRPPRRPQLRNRRTAPATHPQRAAQPMGGARQVQGAVCRTRWWPCRSASGLDASFGRVTFLSRGIWIVCQDQ